MWDSTLGWVAIYIDVSQTRFKRVDVTGHDIVYGNIRERGE